MKDIRIVSYLRSMNYESWFMKNGSLENHLKAEFLEIELREHRLLKVKFVIIMIIRFWKFELIIIIIIIIIIRFWKCELIIIIIIRFW